MSKNDYPEHLNPFAEEKSKRAGLNLSSSFREFTKSLRKSFRIKKKEKNRPPEPEPVPVVQIRPKVYNSGTLPAQTRVTLPVALPRSRFQERLSKTYINGQANHGTLPKSIDATPAYNPFDDDEEIRTIRRRGKKRAPLPPKSISSQNLHADLSVHNKSNWSLTSVETDYTGSIDNVSTTEDALAETLASMNEEIRKLCDDTNNNVISQNEQLVIPDVVVSCSNESEETDKVIVEDIAHNLRNPEKSAPDESRSEHDSNDVKCKGVNPLTKKENEYPNPQTIEENEDPNLQTIEENEDPNLQTKEENEENEENTLKEHEKIKADTQVEVKDMHVEAKDTDVEVKDAQVDVTPLCVEETTPERIELEETEVQTVDEPKEGTKDESIQTVDNKENEATQKQDIDDEVEPTPKSIEINGDIINNNSFAPKEDIPDIDEYLEYNERLSLYIAGSADELNNYTEKNLYISGSKDNLDDNTPVPKQRKHKLSKTNLLGTK